MNRGNFNTNQKMSSDDDNVSNKNKMENINNFENIGKSAIFQICNSK